MRKSFLASLLLLLPLSLAAQTPVPVPPDAAVQAVTAAPVPCGEAWLQSIEDPAAALTDGLDFLAPAPAQLAAPRLGRLLKVICGGQGQGCCPGGVCAGRLGCIGGKCQGPA